jgi:hypothetical protein
MRCPTRRRLALAIALVVAVMPLGSGATLAATGPRLTVDVRRDRHVISRDIHGVSFAAELGGAALSKRLGLTVDRNTGSDWFFENIPPIALLVLRPR